MSGLTSVGGLISGLDTATIVNQLMQLEAQQQTGLKNKVTTAQSVVSAYQSINTRMNALATAAQNLTAADAWQSMKVTTSSSSVAASATTAANVASFTFDVTRLASKQSYVSTGSVAGMSATVAAPGASLTFTNGATGTAVTVDVGDGSLASTVAAINANPDVGVKASAVQVSPGNYRLQLTSTTSGAAAAFTVAGLGPDLGALAELSRAADAEITVGKGSVGSYTVTSSSNTFADVLPGMTFTVSKVEDAVTLDVSRDADRIAAKMQSLVDAANYALAEIARASAYDATTKTGGPLVGDSTARSLTQQVLGALGAVAGALVPGLALTKTGSVTFDKDAFLTAYATDPAKVQRAIGVNAAFGPAGSSTGSVEFVKGGDSTRAGSYEVVITQAARQSTAAVDLSAGVSAGQQITLKSDGKDITYTADGTESAADLADRLNALATAHHLDLVASADGGNLRLHSTGYGSRQTFEVSGDFAAIVTAGADVQGTINGIAATGTGQLLATPASAPGLGALTLKVTLDDADVSALVGGSAGTLTFSAGLAQRLSAVASGATNADNGSLTTVINGNNSLVKNLNDQITDWDRRLGLRRSALEKQYAALEVALGKLQDQSSWLTSQLSSLSSSGK